MNIGKRLGIAMSRRKVMNHETRWSYKVGGQLNYIKFKYLLICLTVSSRKD